MPELDDRLATGAPPQRRIARSKAARLVWWVAAAAAVTTMVTTTGASSMAARPKPYWVGDFRDGTYCQFVTVFESTSVNPRLSSWGGLPACPNYMPYSQDPNQRVHLTRTPAPPANAASSWVSHQELRMTDGPWLSGFWTDKSTIRLTTQQTMHGTFRMGAVRWFRFSLYLPNPGFSWPASGWYDLMDLHNGVKDPTGHDWPTLELTVSPASGDPRYLAFVLDGVRARANYQEVKLLKLTNEKGSRLSSSSASPFNRWHTLIVGVRFSDRGRIGRSPGWVSIYFDGRLRYARHRPNVWAHESGVWFQLQNYKRHATTFADGTTSSTVDFADARIGYSLAAVSG